MTRQVIPHDVMGTGSERALLLHNWFGDRSSFDPMREYLNGDAFSYAFLDCRGYGEAIDADGAFTMDEVAGDALAVADHLGWESFSVIGHSTGGLRDDAWLDGMVSRPVGCSSATAFRAYLDSWARVDFHERVKDNPVPVLLLAGANDPALGPEAMRATWIQWYPNAQLEVLPDTGHYAPEESPEAVAAAIERYLGR